MFRRVLVLPLLLLVVLTGCWSRKVPVIEPGNGLAVPDITNGLKGADQARFHHLAEGSELFPLAWLLAMENPKTGKRFLEDVQRFGLLPEAKSEHNPYGLPVGMTADYTPDLRFANVQMIGFNCAACHVNELHYKGEVAVRIDGAPNLFDLELFLRELLGATRETFSDAGNAWRFVTRLYEVYNPPSDRTAIVSRAARAADKVTASYATLPKMKEGALGKALATQIEEAYKTAVALPADNLEKGVIVRPPTKDSELSKYSDSVKKKTAVKPSAALRKDARALRQKSIKVPKSPADAEAIAKTPPTRTTPLSQLAVPERATAIGEAIEDFIEVVRLLKARADFLQGLVGNQGLERTAPGFGRVDAFGSARNRFFPNDKKPTTAPISYPHLWGFDKLTWIHWDANATNKAVLERNAGQAIGLGALFDPDTFVSTLRLDNLEVLETLAKKIEPPKWPAKFPKIDEAKAKRGSAHFEKHCVKCHSPEMTGDKLELLDDIGTDKTRALNFAQKANGKDFDVALSEVLKKLIRAGDGTTPDEKMWRVTRQYPNRPLKAIWATAPYLHNNSVPTLYHLLLPADQRPKTFAVGHREYDPDKLGYSLEAGTPSFPFDTMQTGNGNGGHEYGKDLSEEQRKELLEYLKTL